MAQQSPNRRDAIISAAAAALSPKFAQSADRQWLASTKAEHVVHVWLGGGMGQIDTFDPKRMGDNKARKPGSMYRSIPTAVEGVQVCEHLSTLAGWMDRGTAIRSITHDVIDEHAAASNFMHTGRSVNATSVYPSFGSIIASHTERISLDVPPYVLIGYPSQSRGSGFLGPRGAYVYFTDVDQGPLGFQPPSNWSPKRISRRHAYLSKMRRSTDRQIDDSLAAYADLIGQVGRIAKGRFMESFDRTAEDANTLDSYGGDLGQRLLVTRRMLQRGVRFVEVSHHMNFTNGTGWDVHNDGINKQHHLIKDLDRSVGAFLADLHRCDLLDKTLVAISSEFGRPAGFDSGGGRGHQGKAFTTVLFGGGLKHCGAYGQTDDLAQTVVEKPVRVADWMATIMASVGIDPEALLYDNDRPVPVTDNGKPILELFG